jgi:hypothetical protein
MWLNDMEVNDKTKFLTDKPTEHDHAICVVNHEMNEELVVPLMIRGVTSTFPTRKPAQDEKNTCAKFELTYDSSEYEPSNDWYATMEDQELALNNHLQKTGDRTHTQHVSSISEVSRQHELLPNKRLKAIVCCSTYHLCCVNIHLQMS